MAKKRSGAKKPPREDIINHSREEDYVLPPEPEVQKTLAWFQDQKLGFMVHWGPYSQLGICESWPLSDGDADWARDGIDWAQTGEELREKYFGLSRTFNPLRFQPRDWAVFARDAGFRYLVFTTKHHDGFCMYDSQHSQYKTTAPDCPFHTHPYANIAKHLFDAFRDEGLEIIPYFSKPDWHCPWYWAEGQAKPVAYNRNPTYDPQEKPELWEQFVAFTQAQMMELVVDLGPVKGLWLDGGQVKPQNGQDIRMAEFAKKARAHNPGLMIADRTIGGPYENYITPEQTVPSRAMNVPWESCVIAGGGFSFAYGADYRSPRDLVHMVMQVVSRGGNLALNLGGQPDGRLPAQGMRSLLKMGEWLRKNGEAVYSTRAIAPYEVTARSGRRRLACTLTQNQHLNTVYATVLLQEGKKPPKDLRIPLQFQPQKLVLTATGQDLQYTFAEGFCQLTLPEGVFADDEPAIAITCHR